MWRTHWATCWRQLLRGCFIMCVIYLHIFLFCSESPPRQSAQPTSLPRQPSHDTSASRTSPRGASLSPSSPTTARPPLSPSHTNCVPSSRQAIALYDFEGDTSLGDLVFQAGETIIDVRSVSAEWMSGRVGDRTGNFPTAFVQISWSSVAWNMGILCYYICQHIVHWFLIHIA